MLNLLRRLELLFLVSLVTKIASLNVGSSWHKWVCCLSKPKYPWFHGSSLLQPYGLNISSIQV